MLRAGTRIMQLRFALPSVSISSLAGNQDAPTQAILDDICLPPFVETKRCNDFDALMRLVAARCPKLVLELGTAHGNTVANICQACPETRVVTVNALAEQISGEAITYTLSKDEIGRVYRRYGFSDRVALHLWGSYRACMVLRRRGFDIRHIKNTWWGVWVNQADGGGHA